MTKRLIILREIRYRLESKEAIFTFVHKPPQIHYIALLYNITTVEHRAMQIF